MDRESEVKESRDEEDKGRVKTGRITPRETFLRPQQPSVSLVSPSSSEWAIAEDSISLVVSDKTL